VNDSAEPAQVVVLMATYDGMPWLVEQLASFERQRAVAVRVVASDDGSRDGTVATLQAAARSLDLELMPSSARMGNANRNFVRLICEAPLGSAAYVALSDQDDVWLDDKLHRAVDAIQSRGLDAYSSDVVAFWPDGRERLLRKAGRQQLYDYVFEAAGPGCSYVFTRSAFDVLRAFAIERRGALAPLAVHDWWIYAFARVRGLRWWIDPAPSLRYRQHDRNEWGANIGVQAAYRRLGALRSGTFRQHALAITTAVGDNSELVQWLNRYGWLDRVRLAVRAPSSRRRLREAAVLAFFHLLSR
jgi:rhamnosyltransferase